MPQNKSRVDAKGARAKTGLVAAKDAEPSRKRGRNEISNNQQIEISDSANGRARSKTPKTTKKEEKGKSPGKDKKAKPMEKNEKPAEKLKISRSARGKLSVVEETGPNMSVKSKKESSKASKDDEMMNIQDVMMDVKDSGNAEAGEDHSVGLEVQKIMRL